MTAILHPEKTIPVMLTESDRIRGTGAKLVADYMHDAERGLVRTSRDQSIDAGYSNRKVEEKEQNVLDEMERCRQKAARKKANWEKIEKAQTLADLDVFLEKRAQEYDQGGTDPGNIWTRVHRAFRTLGSHSKAAQEWLGLLPSESHYLSFVCGSIKFILHAAENLESIRNAVLNALHDIPVLLNGARRVLCLYKSERLNELSDQLYIATLVSIRCILHYIWKEPWKRLAKAVFAQSSFESTLKKNLEDMESCKNNFNEEAAICQQEIQREIHELSVGTKSELRAQTQALLQYAESERARTEGFKEELHLLMKDIPNTIRNEMEKLLVSVFEKVVVGRLVDRDTGKQYTSRPRKRKHSKTADQNRAIHDFFLNQLEHDQTQLQLDAEQNYLLAYILPLRQQDHCVEVIRSPKLKAWFQAPYSGFLAINGNEQLQLRSPLSFVCSRLIYTLDVMRVKLRDSRGQIAAIHFFCGEHVYCRDSMSNPISILNSLLAQLLLSFKDLDLTSFTKLIEFDSTDVDAICDIFQYVLRLLPPTAFVFCVIDNLPIFLADPETMDDAYGLLMWLIGLTELHREKPKSCGFKVLLTAPAQFTELPLGRLRDEQILHVRKEVPPTGGFTELKWDIDMED